MYALILAGASDISGIRKSGYKAGLSIGDGTMLGEAITAVSGLQEVSEIVVVGDEGLLSPVERAKVGRVLEPKGTLFANLELGFSAIPEEGKVLVIASDLPLITTEACQDFLKQCAQREADVYYPVIPKEDYEQSFPGSERTYLRLRGQTFTGGNLVLMKKSFFQKHRRLIRLVVKMRKSPWLLALFFGPGVWWSFVNGHLGLEEIEKLMEGKYGFLGATVISHYSEMGFDVDTTDDLDWIRFYWAGAKDGWKRKEDEDPDEWMM